MKDVVVIMGASSVRGSMSIYLGQLMNAGIKYWIEDLSQAPWLDRGGFIGEKIKTFRRLIQQFEDYEFMVVTDAFDVTFYGDKDELMSKIPRNSVLQGAEKNCYPDPALAARIPDISPWRFANGGLAAGTPGSFHEWCHEVERHPLYRYELLDQHFMNLMLAERNPLCSIDWRTELFYCLFGGHDELQFEDGIPVNTTFCTRPQFLHANGKWDASGMFEKHGRSLARV